MNTTGSLNFTFEEKNVLKQKSTDLSDLKKLEEPLTTTGPMVQTPLYPTPLIQDESQLFTSRDVSTPTTDLFPPSMVDAKTSTMITDPNDTLGENGTGSINKITENTPDTRNQSVEIISQESTKPDLVNQNMPEDESGRWENIKNIIREIKEPKKQKVTFEDVKKPSPTNLAMEITPGATTSKDADRHDISVTLSSSDIGTVIDTLSSITSRWWFKASWLTNVVTIPTLFVVSSLSSLYDFLNTLFIRFLPKRYATASSLGIVSAITVATSWFLYSPIHNITRVIKFIISLWAGKPAPPPEVPSSILQKIQAQWITYVSGNDAFLQTTYNACIAYFDIGYTVPAIIGGVLVAIVTFVIASKLSAGTLAMPQVGNSSSSRAKYSPDADYSEYYSSNTFSTPKLRAYSPSDPATLRRSKRARRY